MAQHAGHQQDRQAPADPVGRWPLETVVVRGSDGRRPAPHDIQEDVR